MWAAGRRHDSRRDGGATSLHHFAQPPPSLPRVTKRVALDGRAAYVVFTRRSGSATFFNNPLGGDGVVTAFVLIALTLTALVLYAIRFQNKQPHVK